MDLTENMFGKIRGRFDETLAHEAADKLNVTAINAIAAMSEEQFTYFVSRFNKIFGPRGKIPGHRITG